MFKKSLSLILGIAFASQVLASKPAPRIQIALLLDASGSMGGLINQAQSKLWSLVNDMALAKKHGQVPKLEVALYMYGHSSLPAADGYIRCLQELTGDLDAISEALFQITTNGGDEYCGQAIQAANTLKWSSNPRDYKAIFIAGNEPFNQGPIDFRKTCAASIAKGVTINTIFCGNEQEGINTFWQEAATLSDGKYMSLNHNAAMVTVTAPQDAEILRLGRELNHTFLGYGAKGEKAKKRQTEQDTNAQSINEDVAVSRAIAKASPAYEVTSWDLVSATQEGIVGIESVAPEALPTELQNKSKEEQKEILKAKAQKRDELQKKIQALKDERSKYLATHSQQKGGLDDVMLGAIRRQMAKLQFEFPTKTQ